MKEKILKERLFKAFGGFADKRIKNLDKSDYFSCNDGAPTDARGKLFLWYCTISVRVISGDMVHIEIGDAMPRNKSVENWWSENSSEGKYFPVIPIRPGEENKLEELAMLIEGITKKPYKVSAYKYECPRVASVLRGIAKILRESFPK